MAELMSVRFVVKYASSYVAEKIRCIHARLSILVLSPLEKTLSLFFAYLSLFRVSTLLNIPVCAICHIYNDLRYARSTNILLENTNEPRRRLLRRVVCIAKWESIIPDAKVKRVRSVRRLVLQSAFEAK